MSIPNELKALYRAQLGGTATRQVVYPVGAPTLGASDAAAGAWAWSAYVQIVAAAVVANPCWLVGIHLHLPTVEAFNGDFAIASGAGGAEVDLAIFPFDEQLFAVVEGKSVIVPCFAPIRIDGSPRLAVRVRKSSAASAAGCSVKVICLTGLA